MTLLWEMVFYLARGIIAMDSEEYLGWCPVENTVANRLKDNSLVHTLSSKSHIRKSTKIINQELKKSTAIKTYSQYLKCKKKILEKITENTDVTDESDFTDDDYKKFYNSFEVTSKARSKSDVGDEGFMWLFIEKQGRKKTESELDIENLDDPHPHIWEPSIDISVIENISDPFEKPSKTPKQKRENGLIDKQFKAKSCSPHKSNTKVNIKNVISATTSKVDNNVSSKLTLMKETPVKEGKELQSSRTKKNVNKRPKDVKRNLTSVINGVSRKTPEASEGDDWNDEFVPSDFQAQSTQIFSDTLSDAHRGRRSVSRRRFSQNEVMNQPRDSGIEEDSREDNVSVNKRADNKKSDYGVQKENKVQENLKPKKTNEDSKNSLNNTAKNIVSNTRHKLPLKIIGEERVTTKYKIVSNKELKSIIEEKHTIIEQIKEEAKRKSESSSDSEYVDTQNGDIIDNSKQETEESSEEYYDLHEAENDMDSDNGKINDSKIKERPDKEIKKLPRDKDELLNEESLEESSITSETSKKNTHAIKTKNKQTRIIIHPNTTSDQSMDESVISDIASLQSSPTSEKQNLSKESRKILNKSSDREESYEIEIQQDLSNIVKNYKKSHFMNKNTEEDSKSIKSLDAKDYDSEDSEKSENEKTLIDLKLTEKNDEEVKVHEQTSKRLSQIKKSELADDEESSESEDEVKKNPPVQFILPDKKSDSEESEESEIEETPVVFQSKKREDDEEGNLSIHAERRLAEMKRIDFANYDDSEDSEEEKSPFPIKNTNAKKKNSKRQKLEDSNESENSTQNASIKNNDIDESESDESEKADSKKDSKPAEKTITKSQDSDSEEEENVPNHTLNHCSQMKKTNLTNIYSSSDDDEIKLENKDQVIDNVKNQAADVEEDIMSSYEKQHLQKMKRLSFDNDSEDSNDSIDKKVEVDDNIDIEEHKVPMPEGYQESELPKLMVEDSFSIGTMEKTESGAEKASKSKKKNKISSKQVKEATDLNEESNEESDIEESKNILVNANKVNVKLSDEDDDSDSDRSMSPSTTHRLSQYKKMNLIEKDSSSSSSEDEDDKKNDVLSKQVESDHLKSDESDEEKSEKLLKSNETSKEDNSLISEKNVSLKSISSKFSNTDNSKESIKTCQGDDNEQKRKATDKDKSQKNVVIHETQESAGTQENYVESQELFSSMEDLTEGQSKASVLDSNDDQRTANEVSATPEPTEISQEKITNIPQLIKKDKLLPATYESTMASSNFSPDEDIYLLEVPRNLFNNNLIGEQFSFSKTTLKVGLNVYEAFKRKVTPTLSCVFKSEDHGHSYETMNVRPAVSIVARRRKLVDEPDKPLHQEKQELEDTGNQSKSTESNPTKIKKKKAKTKDATDTKKVKTPKQVKSSDMTTELEKKKKISKKKADVTNSPGKTKESENYENSAHLLAVISDSEILFKNENPGESPIKSERKEKTPKNEHLKSLPPKVKKDDETLSKENVVVDTMTDAKKKKKKAKAKMLMDSPTKIKKEEITSKKVKSKRNKFDIKHFIQKPKEIKKVKEKKLPKLEHCKDDVHMKRKLSAICDDDRNLMDDKNNASLSPPLKKQKTLIRDATNLSEEDEKQVKLASKSKSKSKIKKVNAIVKTEKKSKVTKPKNTVAENDDVFAETSTSPSTSKSRTENQPAKAEAKKSSKKRKSDALLSDRDDPKAIEKPAKKKKAKAAGEGKPKTVTKAAKERMAKETEEMKNTLFNLFRKTMKCDQLQFSNNSDSNPDKSKYKPLEIKHTTGKKHRLDSISSSSDEDDEKCNFNKSFKMREKPKPELHDGSSNSSSDFIPNSQSAFKSEDKKKPKKIFFNE
ncbi:hypothetical protein TSAR_012385 [Trichomalopsis sarcophagae]|uniref:MATH and LRR domain-containing protein PFE0570w-like n=1 Tax=Trichomalopsis sarcophagae TaxID=543379 RepID=A0A232F4L4_9HYME|nr:hypothetical protein TSAR_012385 [Trichomalopsis sarcophagae]